MKSKSSLAVTVIKSKLQTKTNEPEMIPFFSNKINSRQVEPEWHHTHLAQKSRC